MLGPIFAREFQTVPRSEKHYTARVAALGALWTLGITAWLATNAFGGIQTLGETARFGRLLFQLFAFVTLVLTVFFAALSAAGAVAREKDRRTFILLLMTDLKDSEIVLGKMFGSLLPIGLLLLGMLPMLALLLLLGGMNIDQVVQGWLVLAASAFAAGSLGAFVALWRDRTFQSLAFSVLGIVLYFCLARLIVVVGRWLLPEWDWSAILPWLDPVAALLTAIEPTPEQAEHFPAAVGFAGLMTLIGIILNVVAIWRLRVWNPGREPIQKRETKEDESADEAARAKAHAAPGAIRHVWSNPILWREVCTRAYGRRPFLIKLLFFVVVGLIVYAAMTASMGTRQPFQAAYGLVPIAFLSFLLITAQAATSITSERDVGALDLLLVTDLSPKEFIFGKLLGVAYNVKEYILPPLILVGVYAFLGWLATPPDDQPHLAEAWNMQNLVAIVLALVILLTFVLVLGIFIALRQGNSRQAVLHALGTVFFLTVGTIVCIYLIYINGGTFEYQFLSFSLFLIVGIGGLLWVLSGDLPSNALTLASVLLPLLVFYCVVNVLVGKPGSSESAPPLVPFLVVAVAFGFAMIAMLMPLLSEFDVALGRTRAEE